MQSRICNTRLWNCLPAVSEVSGSLKPRVVLFCAGEWDAEEKSCSRQVQKLDALLERSPKHPPRRTLRKDFNGEALQGGLLFQYDCVAKSSPDIT